MSIETGLRPSWRAELRAAVTDLMPAMIAAAPFAMLLGAIARAKGLAPLEIVLMSAMVFAGSAQFAAIEMWSYPVPIVALGLSTALINARHVLMGLSLAPKLGRLSPGQRYLGVYTMADENWALAERRAATHGITAMYFLGMGAVFWVNWVAWSIAGALLGPVIGDPKRLGADFAFTAIFIGLIVPLARGGGRGRSAGWGSAGAVIASAATAAVVHLVVGSPWHVLAGAFAGIAAAALLWREAPAP